MYITADGYRFNDGQGLTALYFFSVYFDILRKAIRSPLIVYTKL